MPTLIICGILLLLIFVSGFYGWILKPGLKNHKCPSLDSMIGNLSNRAYHGCYIVWMFGTDSEYKKLVEKDKETISEIIRHEEKFCDGLISYKRLLELAKIWDDASQEQKRKVYEWFEFCT